MLPDSEIPGIFNALSLSLLTLLIISVIAIASLVIYLVRKTLKNRTEQFQENQPSSAGDQAYEDVDELSPGNQPSSATATGYSELQLNEVSKAQYETCRFQSTAADDREYETPPDAEGVINSGLYEVPISDE